MTTIIAPNPLNALGRTADHKGVLRSRYALLVAAAFVAGYAGSAAWALPIWLDTRGHYSHGLLVLAIVAYLIWQGRDRLAGGAQRAAAFFALVTGVALCAAIWFACSLAGIQGAGVLTALAVGWLALGTAFGQGAHWRLTPHFALLVSAIPIWQPILNPPLQALAIHVVNWLLRSLGLTIFMEGNTIVMPEITFEIVGGCSGLGYLLVAFTLSIYLALSGGLRLRSGMLLVAGFLALALVSNWLRIAVIMAVGYHYGSMHPLVYDHVWFGWLVFSVVFLPAMFLVVRRLPLPDEHPAATATEAPRIGNRATTALLIAMLAFPALYLALGIHARVTADEPVLTGPASTSNFRKVEQSVGWEPEYPTATRTSLRAYRTGWTADAETAYLYQAHYAYQTNGAEVTEHKNDLAGAGWTRTSTARAEANLGGSMRAVREAQLSDGRGATLLIWSWYRVGDAYADSVEAVKIEQVFWKLRLRPDAALFAAAVPCSETGCESARRVLERFVASLEPEAEPSR